MVKQDVKDGKIPWTKESVIELYDSIAEEVNKSFPPFMMKATNVPRENGEIIKGGREITKRELISWAKKVQSLGAGEILMTSMDTDGVQNGFDSNMLKKVTSNVSIPVIASGGVGSLEHFYLGHLTKSTGLLAASVFHSGKYKIKTVKKYLSSKGVPVRL